VEICGTTHKTVRRVVERHNAGGEAAPRRDRDHNYEAARGLLAEKLRKSQGRISAKRLLPAARAGGYAVLQPHQPGDVRDGREPLPLETSPGSREAPLSASYLYELSSSMSCVLDVPREGCPASLIRDVCLDRESD
jgi:hypothetical protein